MLNTVKENEPNLNNQSKIQKVIDSLKHISDSLQGKEIQKSFLTRGGKTLSKRRHTKHKWTIRRRLRK
jgi:hypothetical protein